MKKIKSTDLSLETIVGMTQKELKSALNTKLTSIGYTPVSKKGFLYAQGEVPVLLVAHLIQYINNQYLAFYIQRTAI